MGIGCGFFVYRETNLQTTAAADPARLSLCLLWHCFDLRGVSLNRYEQILLDYFRDNQDESDYWQVVARDLGHSHPNQIARVQELSRLLWAYFRERADHVAPFSHVFNREGQSVISMHNLAHYLIERWTPTTRTGRRR